MTRASLGTFGSPDQAGTEFDVYSGNANRDLAAKICRYLDRSLGTPDVNSFMQG